LVGVPPLFYPRVDGSDVRRTKILVTLGPATQSENRLRKLLELGVDGFRLNFSHGTDEQHRAELLRVRRAIRASGSDRALVADLQGPKIRLGNLEKPKYLLKEGALLALTPGEATGNDHLVSVSLPHLSASARPGDPILLGDGAVALRVVRIRSGRILARVVNGGALTPHAGVYLPRAQLRTQILGPKDRRDLALALDAGVDFVALSFVRDAGDVERARREIDRIQPSSEVGVIAKIERREALGNIDGILDEADGIMVARGDLGIEVPLERLALEQKMLIRRANERGKTVIVATQMLLSMVSSPRPSRAEATDVANAVLDGTDVMMLSEESAVGDYPLEAVEWLRRIAGATEPALAESLTDRSVAHRSPEDFLAESAVRLATETGATAIVTPTHSGRTARLVARHRPKSEIWAFSASPSVRRQLALSWGVRSFPAPPHQTLLEMRSLAVATARGEGASPDRPLVLTAGYPVEGRPTNLVTLVEWAGVGPLSTRPRDRSHRTGARRRRGAAASPGPRRQRRTRPPSSPPPR
jgi:pyruvate kinase